MVPDLLVTYHPLRQPTLSSPYNTLPGWPRAQELPDWGAPVKLISDSDLSHSTAKHTFLRTSTSVAVTGASPVWSLSCGTGMPTYSTPKGQACLAMFGRSNVAVSELMIITLPSWPLCIVTFQ